MIRIRGARQHNLRGIDLDIPRHKFVVVTGVSGSGKSSLAFDTLHAEGQRRYMESLSTRARQYLHQLPKPQVDRIDGLSPSLALEQRVPSPNPRSTVSTVTEIHDFLRVLFSTAGVPHDPATGEPLRRKTPTEITARALRFPEGTKLMFLAPVQLDASAELQALWDKYRRQGYLRVRWDGELLDLEEKPPAKKIGAHRLDLLIDRIILRSDRASRVAEAVEAALREGAGRIVISAMPTDATDWEDDLLTTSLENPHTGWRMPDPEPSWFSFNSPKGACPACQGIGGIPRTDPSLLVPDTRLSLSGGAIKMGWLRGKALRSMAAKEIASLAERFAAPLDTPWKDLPETLRSAILNGGPPVGKRGKSFEGLLPRVERLYQESKSKLSKVTLRRYFTHLPCNACGGRRLRPESLAVKLPDQHGVFRSISELSDLSAEDALDVVAHTPLPKVLADLKRELTARLEFLVEAGVGYLNLSRPASTLSGGEHQRLRLAGQLGSALSGVLYVLDEPSIGLHPADTEKLLGILRKLRDLENTLVVVEHDPATMRAADWLIEIGPGAGPHGGQLMAEGAPEDFFGSPDALTAAYLDGRKSIPQPRRIKPGNKWLRILDAREHNLKGIDVTLPLGCLVCVTGVSGSGKSTLIEDILRRAAQRHFSGTGPEPGRHGAVEGLENFDKMVVVDQAPAGRTPRSNPATHTGVFEEIRALFAKLPLARARGWRSSRFSANLPGGRCAKCEGTGRLKINLQFLPEAWAVCEECEGKRFNRETLEVTYQGKSIADVLDMTSEEASIFFRVSRKIKDPLDRLVEVGLGYLRLGQSASTLSGGESQRLKLATELGRKTAAPSLYLLDEPTTGLHFHDIELLLAALIRLRDAGHTIIVVEHNTDLIRRADWVVDLGPGGGDAGGHLLVEGSPEDIAACPASLTGRFLNA